MKKAARLTLPQKIIECACAAVILGMILGLLLFWSQIPDRIPGHYNSAGEIDRWGDKWELLLLPSCGVFLYCIISAVWIPIKNSELPRSAYTWLAGTKVVMMGAFAVIEWHSALSRPMGTWLLPVVIALLALLMTGFLVSVLRFVRNQKKE